MDDNSVINIISNKKRNTNIHDLYITIVGIFL